MAEPKRIALCLEYSIEQFGGTEVLVRELIRGLCKRHEITLVSPDKSPDVLHSDIGALLSGHIEWVPGTVSISASRRLARAIADARIQLAHFHFGGNYGWGNRFFAASPVLAVAALGIPCMSTNHGAFSILDGYCGPQRKMLRLALFPVAWVNKLHVLAHLRTEIAVSKHDYHALRRWYWPLRSKFGQIYHSRLHGNPPPPRERQKAVVCVGTIGLRKGQTFLAEAFGRVANQYPDWKLVLIGRHGEQFMVEEIRATVARHQLGDRVLLLNQCTNEEVEQWLKSAAVFAMPSLAEGLGLSLQEAMFNGCACIASAAGGMTDLVEDGVTGILAGPGNVDELAQGLRKLMEDEGLRQRLANQGTKSIIEKEMLADKMVEKYEQLYQSVLASD